jgi:hypothetical protein
MNPIVTLRALHEDLSIAENLRFIIVHVVFGENE